VITASHYRRALDGFDARVRAISDDQWSEPTACCPDWDVRALTAHVAEETMWAPPLLRGERPDAVAKHVERQSTDDPSSVWPIAVEEARRTVTDTALEGAVELPSGRVPASDYIAEMCCDTLIHTWDLADAIGADAELDSEVVDACASWFDDHEDEWRSSGAIGAPADVPEGAEAQTALLARFGRRA
jgi:uncharacterized protein (TIGR03086 family)